MEDILQMEKDNIEYMKRLTFYKDLTINKPMHVGLETTTSNNRKTNKTTFKQRLIVIYKTKYKLKQQAIRVTQVDGAYDIINKKSYNSKKTNSAQKYVDLNIDPENVHVNLEATSRDIKFDGHYALVTSLTEDSVADIIRVSGYRWQIEDHMKTLKFHLKTRPIYQHLDERITAHIAICFTSLLILRILEHLLEYKYTTGQILEQLRLMKVLPENLSIYHATYTGSKLLTTLDEKFNKNLSLTKFTNLQLNKNK